MRYYPKIGSGGGGAGTLKISANDTTAGYLNGKLVAGTGITLTENNDGSNETLSIGLTTSVITDHGGLSGLTDDDHSQYHTDARAETWLKSVGTVTVASTDLVVIEDLTDNSIKQVTAQSIANLAMTSNNIDGGSASAIYLVSQTCDGGGA